MHAGSREDSYASRLAQERRHYDEVVEFDDLPPIYHYWSHTFVRPMLEPLGCSHPREVFSRYLLESARRCGAANPVFASIGSGDCNNEIEIAASLVAAGVTEFTIECVEMNPGLIERAKAAVERAGLAAHFVFVQEDFNTWRPARAYHGVMANQSLHHVTALEHLFDAVSAALAPGACFVASDIIGRNGHQRWPEARRLVERFWRELPQGYRYHRQLNRHEEVFQDWDCSSEGFEGVRSQDVLALLIERFSFEVFVGFGSAIDPFVDRGFGPNFDASGQWDRAFVDRVHACDERALLEGFLTPTHMLAVMTLQPADRPYYARGLAPHACVRPPEKIVTAAEWQRADAVLAPYFCATERRLPLRGGVRQSGDAAGLYEDDWSGLSLEFVVVPERDVRRVTAEATLPQGIPAGTQVWIDVDGTRVATATAVPSVRLSGPVRLAAGAPARVRIATGATANMAQLGLGADVRDLGLHVDAVIFDP